MRSGTRILALGLVLSLGMQWGCKPPRRPNFGDRPEISPAVHAIHIHKNAVQDPVPHPAGSVAQLDEPKFSSGSQLYVAQCQACHGSPASLQKKAVSAKTIYTAIQQVKAMQGMVLSSAEIAAIADTITAYDGSKTTSLTCSFDPKNPAPVEETIRPLSRSEYTNTLRTLFGSYLSFEPVALELRSIPVPSNRTLPFENVGNFIGDAHFKIYTEIAQKLSEKLLTVPEFVRDAFGSEACLGSEDLSRVCLDTFYQKIGRSIFRRILTEDDRRRMDKVIVADQNARLEAETLIQSSLLSSDFLFQSRAASKDFAQNSKIKVLSGFELASRLSYALWSDMPDETLFKLAESDSLKDPKILLQEIDRMLMDPKARSANAKFFEEWLQLRSRMKPVMPDILRDGLTLDANFADEIARESGEFVNRIVFDEKLGFGELMLSPHRSPKTPMLEAILKGSSDEQRPGLLWRVVLANSSMGPSRNLIHSGTVLRQLFLCEKLPDPPASLSDEVKKATMQDFSNISTRDEVTKKTQAEACKSCHILINPLAFTGANAYDSLGRYITQERRLQADQSLLKFAIDAKVDDIGIESQGESPVAVDGPYALAQVLAEHQKAKACYLTQRYAFILGRAINSDPDRDGCVLKRALDLMQNSNQASLLDTLKALIGPEFQYRRIVE